MNKRSILVTFETSHESMGGVHIPTEEAARHESTAAISPAFVVYTPGGGGGGGGAADDKQAFRTITHRHTHRWIGARSISIHLRAGKKIIRFKFRPYGKFYFVILIRGL